MTAALSESLARVRRGSHEGGLSLSEFVRQSGLRSLVIGASKDANAKITVLLVSDKDGRPALAVKAATTDTAALAVEAEARMLVAIRRLQPLRVIETIPRFVRIVELDDRPAVVMTAIPGRPMSTSYLQWRHTARRARVAADFAAAATWLAAFQAETAGAGVPLEMDGGVTSRLSTRFAHDERLDRDLELLAETHDRLRTETVPRTAVHGDFWLGNVLLDGPRISGVVDWEAGTPAGEPVRDLVRFAHMYALYLDRSAGAGRRVAGHPSLRANGWGAGVEYALDGTGWFPELLRGFLTDGLVRLGASPAVWRDAALAGVAEVAALTDDDGFARRHLELFRRLAHTPKERS